MENQVAIVTGAASGIGLAIAKSLREQNYTPVVFDIKNPPANEDLPYVHCDVSSEEAVTAAYKEVRETYGPCALLVNNSGLQHMAPVEDFPLEKWNQLIGSQICQEQI